MLPCYFNIQIVSRNGDKKKLTVTSPLLHVSNVMPPNTPPHILHIFYSFLSPCIHLQLQQICQTHRLSGPWHQPFSRNPRVGYSINEKISRIAGNTTWQKYHLKEHVISLMINSSTCNSNYQLHTLIPDFKKLFLI